MRKLFINKIVSILLLLTILLPHSLFSQEKLVESKVPAPVLPTNTTDTLSQIEALRTSLEKLPTHLEYTKYLMLKNQQKALYGKEDSDDYYSDYNLKPRGASPLSREYSGIPITTNSFTYNSSVTSGIDLITGGTAINESLQLGSVGSNANNNMSREHQTQHQRLTSAIRNFRMDNKVYPDSLSQLDLKSTFGSEYQTIIDNFVYTKKANTYTLYLSPKIPPVTLPISEVAGLTIKHHSWNEMIAGATPTIPDIYKLIPDDYFFIHFNNLKNYQELETTISDLKGPLSHVYGIGDSLAARDRIFEKLGITKDTDLDIFLDEVVLMSYDFDGYPATDYALILKLKSTMLNNFVSNYVTGPASNRGEVGDYYVVATNEQLFKHIKTTADKPADSMATALDLKYSLTVLAEERDGLAFISDAFVEKITSPTYRINARRRNTVLKALETLQYSILAYKDITGAWPKNISTMIDENYLRGDSVYELNKYSINDQGVVSHQDWGSIYNVTPISQVKIDTVQVAEKDLYDNFREGYQQLWREFIDPVAVSILIGDQIRFHTIILPLIDSSEYNWIKNMVGSKDTELDFVTNPDRIPAIQLASHFDTNSILYAAYKANPREFDAEYSKCIKEYYQNRINDFTSSGSTKNTCVAKGELSEAEAILAVKTSVAELINWEGSKAELFSFMGDEVSLAASENVSFMINDLSNFDVYLGLEFSNPAEGKIFVEHLFDWVFEEIFGGETMSMGIFGIAPGKPIKNTYNNVEYYTLPTGWINLFYVFIDDRMYLTLSQNTINSLIDGKDGTKWPEHMSRLQDYLDSTQDVSLLVDGQKLDKWIEGFAKQNLLSYAVSANLESMRTYLKEVSLLEQTTSNAAEKFYSYIPTNWFGLPVETKGGKTYVNTYDGLIDLDNVQTSRYSYYSYSKKGDNPDEIKFADFMKYLDIEGLIKEWTGFDTFGADLNITKHGLDIQVAFNNSVRSEHDSRVPGKNKINDVDPVVYLSVIVLLFVLSLLGIVVFKRVKEESQNQTEGQSFTPDYSDQPNNQTTGSTSSFSDKIDKLIQ